MILDILADGVWAAIAGIGFGAISNPPKRAFVFIAILAAIGHALRYFLMKQGMDIASASFCAALTIGMGSLWFGRIIYCPMTVLYIPALLPMIPGMYAYKTVFSFIMFMQHLNDSVLAEEYMMKVFQNTTITVSVVFLLAVGATLPIFIFSKRAFSLTRRKSS